MCPVAGPDGFSEYASPALGQSMFADVGLPMASGPSLRRVLMGPGRGSTLTRGEKKEQMICSFLAASVGGQKRLEALKQTPAGLFQVGIDQLGQFEHRYLVFVENGTQLRISVDITAIAGILKVVFLDVIPDFLRDLGARHGFRTDDGCQFGAGGQGLHEGGVRLARGGGGCGHYAALLLWMIGKKCPARQHNVSAA